MRIKVLYLFLHGAKQISQKQSNKYVISTLLLVFIRGFLTPAGLLEMQILVRGTAPFPEGGIPLVGPVDGSSPRNTSFHNNYSSLAENISMCLGVNVYEKF